MTAADWATTISAYFGIAVVVLGGGYKVLGKAIQKSIDAHFTRVASEMEPIKAELSHNGGSSLTDKIKLEMYPMLISIREDLTEMKVKQAEIEGKIDLHVQTSHS